MTHPIEILANVNSGWEELKEELTGLLAAMGTARTPAARYTLAHAIKSASDRFMSDFKKATLQSPDIVSMIKDKTETPHGVLSLTYRADKVPINGGVVLSIIGPARYARIATPSLSALKTECSKSELLDIESKGGIGESAKTLTFSVRRK